MSETATWQPSAPIPKSVEARGGDGGNPPFLYRSRRAGGGDALHESGDGNGYSFVPVRNPFRRPGPFSGA